jgi:hypothetical protein
VTPEQRRKAVVAVWAAALVYAVPVTHLELGWANSGGWPVFTPTVEEEAWPLARQIKEQA